MKCSEQYGWTFSSGGIRFSYYLSGKMNIFSFIHQNSFRVSIEVWSLSFKQIEKTFFFHFNWSSGKISLLLIIFHCSNKFLFEKKEKEKQMKREMFNIDFDKWQVDLYFQRQQLKEDIQEQIELLHKLVFHQLWLNIDIEKFHLHFQNKYPICWYYHQLWLNQFFHREYVEKENIHYTITIKDSICILSTIDNNNIINCITIYIDNIQTNWFSSTC